MSIFIDNIFKDNGFERIILDIDGEKIDYWVNYDLENINFYLVVYLEKIPEDFLDLNIPNYFGEIKSLSEGYVEQMDKNLSLLVLIDESKNKLLNNDIFKIEEDPYYFKKYVLSYNVNTIIKIEKQFEKFNGTSIEFINSIVNNTDKFTSFKTNDDTHQEDNDIYDLCSKFMIKIPFISLFNRTENLNDLSRDIDEALNNLKLLELKEELLDMEQPDSFNFSHYIQTKK